MLKFICGAVNSKRDELLCEAVKKSCENDENVLVIIPDQFSAEYDKKLYDYLGPVQFNKIKTAGFNRLAEIVSREYGNDSKENANENVKIIVMYKAVCRLKETRDIRFYKRALDKGAFLGEVISLISEMIQSGITPADLKIASEKFSGAISHKLFDLSRLYEYYLDELLKAGLKDTLTSLGECVKLVNDNEFFKGTTIFLNAFSSFSSDEYRLIESMLIQANSLTVSLVISNENNANTNQTPFAQTIRTRTKIMELADDHNISYDEIISSCFEYNSNSIEYINKNLYCAKPLQSKNHEGVEVFSATEIYEETEYVCSEISRLVREENYAYKNIAVVARNLGDIESVVEGTFERYEIPYFIDKRQNIEQSSLVLYLKSIFACVMSRKWKTEDLLKYIKSPLCRMLNYDICNIENYCYKWNVNGEMWLEDFTAHESGKKVSKRLNENRKEIIEPLVKFKNACENANGKVICEALFDLLDEIKTSQAVFSLVKRASASTNNTDLELGRTSKQVWETVLLAVQTIYENLGDEKLTLRRFYDIFKLMISQMTVSSPPQKVDCIRVADAGRSRLNDVKVLFVIEANDGIFPADIKSEGLLTQRDKRQLESEGINLNTTTMSTIENERLTVYQTVTMPSDKLYVLCSESDTQGKKKNPSVLINMILEMFEDLENRKVHDIPVEFFCTSYQSAYYKFLEKSKDNTTEIKSLEKSLNSSEFYKKQLKYVMESAQSKSHKLSEKTAKEVFFGHDLNISATRISEFYNCPFNFYCKYGLKLFPNTKVEYNRLYRGNIAHACLEMIMSKPGEKRRVYNEEFVAFSDDDIKDKVKVEVKSYLDEKMGGDFGKTSRFNQEIARLEKSIYYMIKVVQEDLRGSLFKPEAFEFDLSKDNGQSILRLKISDGYNINIRGSVDRVDVYQDDAGNRFLKIVDYKTGVTKFNLSEFYHGLNMQMMIYILAITRNVNEINFDDQKNINSSAVFYTHLQDAPADFTPNEISEITKSELEEKMFLKRMKNCKPDGEMISNNNSFNALNLQNNGVFTPFTLLKNNDFKKATKEPIKKELFIALEDFALEKVENMANKLLSGDIKADPICSGEGRNAKLPCRYCDYWSICANANPMNPRMILKSDDKKLLSELESKVAKTNESIEKEGEDSGS